MYLKILQIDKENVDVKDVLIICSLFQAFG